MKALAQLISLIHLCTVPPGGTMMRWVVLLSALLPMFGLVACQSVAVPLDPAVALCETRLLSSLLTIPSYKRLQTKIDGAVTSVTYEAQNLGGATLRQTFECRFTRGAPPNEHQLYFIDDPDWQMAACLLEQVYGRETCGQLYAVSPRITLTEGTTYPILDTTTSLVVGPFKHLF